MGGGQTLSMGPYEADFNFKLTSRARVMPLARRLLSGVFDDHLSDFGSTEERGIINPDPIIMTSYVGENMEGGGTKSSQGKQPSRLGRRPENTTMGCFIDRTNRTDTAFVTG